VSVTSDDDVVVTADIVALATRYAHYSYRRITAPLRHAGWVVNRKGLARSWRRVGLKVPQKQPKRRRLCGRRIARPAQTGAAEPVWAYDFVEDRTHDGTGCCAC